MRRAAFTWFIKAAPLSECASDEVPGTENQNGDREDSLSRCREAIRRTFISFSTPHLIPYSMIFLGYRTRLSITQPASRNVLKAVRNL